MPKLSNELKAAISHLSDKEKNKLLNRLIAKDAILVEQLTYELLEDGNSMEERNRDVLRFLEENIPPKEYRYLSPDYLLMYLRSCNPRITRHVRVTKDKLGAVSLTVAMLRIALERHLEMFKQYPPRRSEKITKYIMARLIQVFKKMGKLHEDLYIEFSDDLQKVLDYVYDFEVTAIAAEGAAIPRRWDGGIT